MPSTSFTASDRRNFLAQLYTFATTNGWTGQYDQSASTGNIALSRGNCLISIGEEGVTDTFTDALGQQFSLERVRFALNTAFTASEVWDGHTRGDNAVPSSTAEFPQVDDLVGTTTIYLFTDSSVTPTYIHGMIRAADGLRWQGFTFGLLDKGAFTTPDVAYVTTNRYRFWFGNASPTNSNAIANDPSNGNHIWIGDWNQRNVRVPSGVLDPTLGFLSGDNIYTHNGSSGNQNSGIFRFSNVNRRSTRLEAAFDAVGGVMQGYLSSRNQNLTGGAPLWTIPLVMEETSSGLLTYLGDIPDMRMCDMSSFGALQTFQQGSDNWQAFPWGRIGLEENARTGSAPTTVANSTFYGQAVKVVP